MSEHSTIIPLHIATFGPRLRTVPAQPDMTCFDPLIRAYLDAIACVAEHKEGAVPERARKGKVKRCQDTAIEHSTVGSLTIGENLGTVR
eukprot:scaffold397_cov403-Prasinococcus_capsulatus_cf.AAC.4